MIKRAVNMALGLLLHAIVIEFPKNEYILSVNKSASSGYECVILSSSYKQTASYFFRWFRNMQSSCTEENAGEKISAMIEVFRTYKEELFVALRDDILIEGIIQTCFDLQLDDSDLICEVLNLMYESWCSFGPLHFKSVLGRRSRRIKGRRFPDLLTFFLEHARRRKLKFDGVRMIDASIYSSIQKSPVALAADVWCWKEMLVYLQYGARLEHIMQDPIVSHYGVSLAITEVLRTLLKHLWFRLVYPFVFGNGRRMAADDYCAGVDADVRNLCLTLNIILRTVRRVRFRSLDFLIRDTDERNTILLVPSSDVIKHLTTQIMIPKLAKRYEEPEELRHICRWAIRKRLNENWQLPHGIQDLPLPRSTRKYLNLLID